MIDYRKLINLIKEEKDKQGLTLEMLAAKSGIARGTLNKLMSSSTKSIKMEHIAKLSNALGLQLTQLLEDEQSESDKLPPYWGYIRVASCTPSLKVANCVYNADKIIETALELNKKQVCNNPIDKQKSRLDILNKMQALEDEIEDMKHHLKENMRISSTSDEDMVKLNNKVIELRKQIIDIMNNK